MLRIVKYVPLAVLFAGIFGAISLAQDSHSQSWTDNQDGSGFDLFDAGSLSANNLATGGPTFSNPSTGEIVNGYPAWWSQVAWFVDPQNSSGLASDSNTGLTNTTPLRTWRRSCMTGWGPAWGSWPCISRI